MEENISCTRQSALLIEFILFISRMDDEKIRLPLMLSSGRTL